MKIDKLVLKNYKRLMLSNIRHFEWSPKSSIMLLLGSNGSGKSSLMEELTPCPAHHTQFEKTGGLKEFHCTHGNHSYILISTYNGGSGSHSFIRDLEEELNPGGTFAVQKELVAKIFGLDRGIHDILTGVTTFSSMPTATSTTGGPRPTATASSRAPPSWSSSSMTTSRSTGCT